MKKSRGSGNAWVESLKKLQTNSDGFMIPKKGTALYKKAVKAMPKPKKKKAKKKGLTLKDIHYQG